MVNKVFLIGRLGHAPELRTTSAGHAVCSFSLATNRTWKDRDGERQEETEWHQVVAWGPTAEAVARYLGKGSTAHVEGRLRTREWEDNEGQRRRRTEVVAELVTFLDGAGRSAHQDAATDAGRADTGGAPAVARGGRYGAEAATGSGGDGDGVGGYGGRDDDIPF